MPEEMQRELGESQAGGAAQKAEPEALRQCLSRQPPAAGAQGRAHRHLAAAGGRSRQHQAGDIGARDQPEQGHRAQQR